MAKRVSQKKAQRVVSPKKSQDVPVTQQMLYEVRDELKSSIVSLELKTDSRLKDIDARFNKVDARFDRMEARFKDIDARFDKMEGRFKDIDARFDNVDSRFLDMESGFKQVLAEIHRVGLLVEEQNARNLYVLDGYTSLSDRLSRVEDKVFGESK